MEQALFNKRLLESAIKTREFMQKMHNNQLKIPVQCRLPDWGERHEECSKRCQSMDAIVKRVEALINGQSAVKKAVDAEDVGQTFSNSDL